MVEKTLLDPVKLKKATDAKKQFVVWVDSERDYFRPLYGATPMLGYLCIVTPLPNHNHQAFISKVIGEQVLYESARDCDGYPVYDARKVCQRSGAGSYGRFYCLLQLEIPCLLRRVDRKLIETTGDDKTNKEAEEDDTICGLFFD